MILKLKEIIKVIIIAFVEGVSEWLPISSSGHILLLDKFLNLELSSEFKELFFVFIQLGAILAVIIFFFKDLIPFKKEEKIKIDKEKIRLWEKIIIACIPGGIIALLFDEYIETYLHKPFIIALMLIIYGIIFIFIEKIKKDSKINEFNSLTNKDAFKIGLFQVLSLVPGTSRSGATIIGSLLIGVNKECASKFSFYLAIPVMLGMSLLKLIKYGFIFSVAEIIILIIGMLVAFLVSLIVIKFLLNYVNKHSFKVFGIYRIILGVVLLFVL